MYKLREFNDSKEIEINKICLQQNDPTAPHSVM